MAEENGSKVVWFLMGAAIGGAVALLLAPQSGRETRKMIVKTTGAGRDALLDTSRELIDKGREYYEKGRKIAEEAGEVFERGRQIVKG